MNPWMVVLDSKVLEAAMRSRRGASFAVLGAVRSGRVEIALSVSLVLEYEEVLLREPGRSAKDVRDLLDFLCSVARQQSVFFLWRPCLPDADDDMLLELAVAAQCDAIVTHNIRDFVPAEQFGMPVMTPARLLEKIGGDL